MFYIAGWLSPIHKPKKFRTLKELEREEKLLKPKAKVTWKALLEAARYINSEGNYHPYILLRAEGEWYDE